MTASPRFLVLQNTSILDGYGGIEYYLDDLLTLLTEIGGEDTATALVPERRKAGKNLARPYPIHTVPFRATGIAAKVQNRFSWSYFAAAKELARRVRPHYLVCGHVSLGPLTYALHRATGIPYLTCAYGIECWGNLAPPDEWTLYRAEHIWSISHWTKQRLVRRGYLKDRISVVHPRLPTHFEQVVPSAEPISKETPFRLLTVSRLDAREQYKGQDHVIEALHRLRLTEPELPFHYIIQGDGSDRGRLRRMVAERDLADIVEFRDSTPDREELASLYRSVDLFVMPSRFGYWEKRWRGEGFGIVYLEAAAFGIPSLAYDCGGATDIIEDGKNGILIAPDDIGALARKLAQLARDRRYVRDLGQTAHQMVMSHFTRPAIRQELVRALSELSSERPESATMSQSRAMNERSRAR